MLQNDGGAFAYAFFALMPINKTIGKAVQRLVENRLPPQLLGIAATNMSSFLVHFN